MITKLLVEQHFHGCYGVDFNNAGMSDISDLAYRIKKEGIGGIFPTLVTDTIENTKRQIKIIKDTAAKLSADCAKILGIHLEGIFLNTEKKGIHNEAHFLLPTIENFEKINDDFIKIVTLAPELSDGQLIPYLNRKGIKVQAGHCMGSDLSGCSGTTHTFNAMGGISHKNSSTVLSALLNDDIYTEVIADGIHVCPDALKLLFRIKPQNKILLVSDCLPCTRSELKNFIFADQKVYYDGERATSADGTLAGSTKLLPDIIKLLHKNKLFNPAFIENPYNYHKIELNGSVEWDEDFNIVKVI